MTELGYPPSTPTTLYQDNESTINMIYHKGNAGRSKHIALRYNIIREYVADGTIKVVYCPTSQMMMILMMMMSLILFVVSELQ